VNPERNTSSKNKQVAQSGAEVLNSLSEDQLKELLDRLRLFAFRHYHGALDCENLAMEAVKQVLAANRSWDPSSSPFTNLCWITKSLASNQLKKDERNISLEAASEILLDDSIAQAPVAVDEATPANIFEAKEVARELSELIDRASSGDSILRRIIRSALKTDGWKPKEIAREFGIDTSQINNAKRRMQRVGFGYERNAHLHLTPCSTLSKYFVMCSSEKRNVRRAR
jgi:DNA-directed RNA polymerase specialized sigma24 family protein